MALKDIFIKNNTDTNQVTQSVQETQAVQMNTGVFANQANEQRTSEINDNIVKNLWQVLIDKNLPGPDFLEVKNTAAALQAMNLPIDKCYEAAFRTIQASNPDFTKQKLINSIDTYISFINQEQADGKKECERKRQIQVGDKQERGKQLLEHKSELEQQIADLQEQITQTESSIMKLKLEIEKSSEEIDKEENIFNNSIESVIASLNSDKEIMSNLNI